MVLLQKIKTMSASSKRTGLSARQRTSSTAKKSTYPKPFLVFLIALSLMMSACHERSNGQENVTSGKDTASVADSVRKPDVNIEVNKHYDKQGNVIGVDSTYTSYYSNIEGDTSRFDSLIQSFDSYFKGNHFNMFEKEFNSLFFSDSSRYPGFLHDDFFLNRHEYDSHFRNMMNRMDSIRNSFYDDRIHPGETRDL